MGLPLSAPSGSLCPQSTNPSLEPSTSSKNDSKPVSSPTVTTFSWQLFWSHPFILPWGHLWEQKECQLVYERLAHAEEMVATSYFAFCPHTLVPARTCCPARGPPTPLSYSPSFCPPPLITLALALLGASVRGHCWRPRGTLRAGGRRNDLLNNFLLETAPSFLWGQLGVRPQVRERSYLPVAHLSPDFALDSFPFQEQDLPS